MKKVCVEQSLSHIQDALKQEGYDVVEMQTETDAQGCDCCVISGFDENIMGIQNTVTKAPVINASGLSPQDVLNLVKTKTK
ncbi:YkuS family protein [Massilibacterium senegalense]|uniref:YkuS family protein n=1 Tax=Massilibacterium senegalense TaxID=1632858 RepID=UPI0007829C73